MHGNEKGKSWEAARLSLGQVSLAVLLSCGLWGRRAGWVGTGSIPSGHSCLPSWDIKASQGS